jgi:hypothetical protein
MWLVVEPPDGGEQIADADLLAAEPAASTLGGETVLRASMLVGLLEACWARPAVTTRRTTGASDKRSGLTPSAACWAWSAGCGRG